MPTERRSGGTIEASGRKLVGYALTYEQPYDVNGGPDRGGFVEVIARGAARRAVTERHDVRLLVDHKGSPLARTKSGTLVLRSDDHGLRVEATLDPSSPDAQSLLAALRRGDLDAMSFGFRVPPGGDKWSGSVRRIADLDVVDVSVVTYPANPATSVALRSSATSRTTSRPARRTPTPPQRLRALRYSTRGPR